jgi:TPR repeat protein
MSASSFADSSSIYKLQFEEILNEKIIKQLKPLAEQGDAKAQYNLGLTYTNYVKDGVRKKDYETAAKWLQKSANQGYANAQGDLATMYLTGRGVNENHKKAISLLKKSARQDYARAQYNLGKIYEDGKFTLKDNKKAIKWYKKASNSDDTKVQIKASNSLGSIFFIDKNYKESFKWSLKAAEQKDASSQFRVGAMYAYGIGALEDLIKAKYWISKFYDNPQASSDSINAAKEIWSEQELWRY